MTAWCFALNIVTALLLGGAIGLERQWRQHTAGLRTNTLVALGAAMFVSLSALMDDSNSPTRIASYIVSGLGFLGGGVILRDGLTVKGMNTAATLWCTGAVGTLAGAGFHWHAVLGTAAILFVHVALRPLVNRIEARRRTAPDVEINYRIRVRCRNDHEAVIRTILLRHVGSNTRMSIQSLATEESEKEQPVVVADIYAAQRDDRFIEQVVARISIEPDVTAVSWEKSGQEG
jgi:putative Mg2+ transporter-C (MgtC) family protein